jgi:isoquinoline 1-oxidoreductase subunit beta
MNLPSALKPERKEKQMIPSFNVPARKAIAMATTLPASRRGFLIGALAVGSSLVIGFRNKAVAAETPAASAPVNPLAAYVKIGADNKVTIYSSQMEFGQGAYHGIATLVNEELGADWKDISVEGGSGNVAVFGNVAWGGAAQGTGGSTSMVSSWERYRKAGAAARIMLVEAAAAAWKVPAAEIKAENGMLSHASGKTATYGEMAGAAAALSIPADVPLKSKEQWTQIGSDTLKRYDSKTKTDGSQNYTIDVKLPGLVTAVMIHPPKFGATVASFDAAAAKAMKGVVDVVQIPRGIAVVADTMWTALKARDVVTVTWDETKAEQRGSAEIIAAYRDQATKPGIAVARNEGDADGAFAKADKVIEATFEFPYLAHAALEPLNAVVQKNGDMIEIWGGHQMPDLYQYVASQAAGTTPDKVKLHVMKAGGSFGRRAVTDADVIAEAVAIGAALQWKHPVKVQWTRENDMKGGRYRPAYVHRVKAGLDKDGKLVAWNNHVVGQSILAGTPFEQALVTNGVDLTSVEGASTIPYAIPNIKVELSTMAAGVPVLWWRAVGSTHTAFAVETFIDELAEAAGKDPVEFRLAMLDKHPRHQAVLKLAAEKAGWGTPAPEGVFRGVALAESFSTIVAQIVEITMPSAGTPKVQRVVTALDCGTVINPDQVRAQVEGSVGFGLGAIMQEELTLTGGVVQQANFDGYTPLRIDQMPKVEVHWIASDAAPTGIGEPGVPPVGPALANAVYQATKKRVRILPMAKGLSA